jgi:hypothetical protein
VLIDHGVAAEGSLPAQARNAGLDITGWAPVTGEMFWTLREHCSPDLPLAQLAARLGFTVQQWKLMEADERMVPDPDDFWDPAMDLVGKLDGERKRRADVAGFN